jgi:hypothetical protein
MCEVTFIFLFSSTRKKLGLFTMLAAKVRRCSRSSEQRLQQHTTSSGMHLNSKSNEAEESGDILETPLSKSHAQFLSLILLVSDEFDQFHFFDPTQSFSIDSTRPAWNQNSTTQSIPKDVDSTKQSSPYHRGTLPFAEKLPGWQHGQHLIN